MADVIDRIGAELVRAARVDPLPPEAAPRRRAMRSRRGWRMRWRPVLIACGLLLAAAAAALAANLAFAPGTAVGPEVPPNPAANDGAAIPGTAKLLPLSVADPRGGLPWGLRLVRTTRGETCIQIGRLDYHTLGVLGQDGAFGNDHRFHPLSDNYLDPMSCAVNDARGHAFINIGDVELPASASAGERGPGAGCLGGIGRLAQPCPTRDMRTVYYGLLGPDAVSVSYRHADGRFATSSVAGADGAYLIVLPVPTRGRPAEIKTGWSGGISSELSGNIFHAVRYRGGHTCLIVAIGGSCPPVGFVPATSRVTPAQVAAPISLHVLRAARRVEVSFTARVGISDSHAYYSLDLHFPHSHICRSYEVIDSTHADLRAGQRVSFSEGIAPRTCPGRYWGTVSYVPDTGRDGYPDGLPGGSRLPTVGRFSFRLR